LKFNGHPNKALQADWNNLCKEQFEAKILDTLEFDKAHDRNLNEDLEVLFKLWIDKLQPFETNGYHTRS